MPPQQEPPEGADGPEPLTELFWSVARRLRRTSFETLAPLDVAPSQGRALGALGKHGDMRPSALSEHLHITPRSVTEMVDSLEARGLVARAKDPRDRRATIISLTPKGAALSEAIRTARAAEGERIFGDLSTADRTHLRRILAKLQP